MTQELCPLFELLPICVSNPDKRLFSTHMGQTLAANKRQALGS